MKKLENQIGVYNDPENITINVVDSVMGSGKTSAMINYINESDDNTHFIYVTPYLTEVKRIIESCPNKKFEEPQLSFDRKKKKTTKIKGLQELLKEQKNIVTTHSLFHRFNDEIIDLCYNFDYVLIMDEVTDVINEYNNILDEGQQPISRSDVKMLLDEKYIRVENGCMIKWNDEKHDYTGRFEDIRHKADSDCLAMYGQDIMLWLFPIKMFKAFRKIYILTYLFSGQLQKYYYDYFGLKYNKLYAFKNNEGKYVFTSKRQNYKKNYSELIDIITDKKINQIGDNSDSLSKSWYTRNIKSPVIEILKKNLSNLYKNKKLKYDIESKEYVKASANDVIWTTFKSYKNNVKVKNFSGTFVSCNMRATNEYSNASVVMYPINMYINPFLKNFFVHNNIPVYEEAFSLSEMLQFIWRSRIRNDEKITVYVPSKRMRTLLENWIKANSIDDNMEVKK